MVQLSKDTIRANARKFSVDWAGTTSERGSSQTFWVRWFEVFGLRRENVAIFEEAAERTSTGRTGWVDVFVPGEMAIEQKSAGVSLDRAMQQLVDYLPSLPTAKQPWLLVVSDFEVFRWRNLRTGTSGEFPLADFAANVPLFWWLAEWDAPTIDTSDAEAVNLAASQRLADVHDALIDSGYDPHDAREWVTRILFCLFADDTEVWDPNAFHSLVASCRPDGSDLGRTINEMFEVLDTAPERWSQNLTEEMRAFRHINGDLFGRRLPTAQCNTAIRDAILECCGFNWEGISPAIFGSMFQNVMTPRERRHLGAHYTSERDILRLIRPLFLDDLEGELRAANSIPRLTALHDKLASLRFLDPAMGCGNFLVIAYREIRRIELELLRKTREHGRRRARNQRQQLEVSLDFLCRVNVSQFYGIEIEEFPALIARTALYLMDHKANLDVSNEFAQTYARFPIPAAPSIHVGNALTSVDWNTVLPAGDASFVFGNPPFIGKGERSAEQSAEVAAVMGKAAAATVDYVGAWYQLAANYMAGTGIRAAFVSTNSITQGEQVPVLWPPLIDAGIRINFAHRTFAWRSEARGPAHVHCVIVGFDADGGTPIRPGVIFDYPDIKGDPVPRAAAAINAYLTDAEVPWVPERAVPLGAVPQATFGSMPNDNSRQNRKAMGVGNLLLTDSEAAALRATDPIAARYLRPLMSAKEMLSGENRWCLWLVDLTASDRRASPELTRRIERVQRYREGSQRAATKRLAATPALFAERRQPTGGYLCVPRHATSTRPIIPMQFCTDEIASDSTVAIPGADLYLFGVLQSQMFAAWLRAVGGYIKSDYRFSIENVYNTFPFPTPSPKERTAIADGARAVLAARASSASSLGDCYDPLTPDTAVAAAHRRLDRLVDSLFAGSKRPTSDVDRLPYLFRAYRDATAATPELPLVT